MEPASSDRARPRVLLVDDEPEALRTLTALLRRDYEILTAPNALAAMQELSRFACHAVISDERMPGMSGTRFLGYVRRTYPDTARLILTAYSDSDTLLRAINEGEVERFLLKPVQPVLLRQAIAELLARHSQDVADRHRSTQLVRRNAELEARVRELDEQRRRVDIAEGLALAGQLGAGLVRDLMARLEPDAGAPTTSATADPVASATRQLDELAGELVELEHGEKPRYALAPVRLDLWVRDFVRGMGGKQPLHERHVNVEVDGEVWCLLDPPRFGRLAAGLVENAIDATRAGDAITFRVGPAGPSATFEVANTGIALRPELRQRVFEPFFTTRPQRAGLGLHVCKLIAEAHGGTIECDTIPDRETRFRVRLPRLER